MRLSARSRQFVEPGDAMSGTPSSIEEPPTQQLRGIQFIGIGLVAGLGFFTAAFVAVMISALKSEGMLGEDQLSTLMGYGSLVLVPMGLLLAFVVLPDPGRAQAGGPTFGAYSARFFIQAGVLEGNAIVLLVVFLLTACWAVLAGVAILMAALAAIIPTAEKYRAWAAQHTAMADRG
jgi:hypothetical protein